MNAIEIKIYVKNTMIAYSRLYCNKLMRNGYKTETRLSYMKYLTARELLLTITDYSKISTDIISKCEDMQKKAFEHYYGRCE